MHELQLAPEGAVASQMGELLQRCIFVTMESGMLRRVNNNAKIFMPIPSFGNMDFWPSSRGARHPPTDTGGGF